MEKRSARLDAEILDRAELNSNLKQSQQKLCSYFQDVVMSQKDSETSIGNSAAQSRRRSEFAAAAVAVYSLRIISHCRTAYFQHCSRPCSRRTDMTELVCNLRAKCLMQFTHVRRQSGGAAGATKTSASVSFSAAFSEPLARAAPAPA